MKMMFNTDQTRFYMIFEKDEFQSAAQLMQMIHFVGPRSVEDGLEVIRILEGGKPKPDLKLV